MYLVSAKGLGNPAQVYMTVARKTVESAVIGKLAFKFLKRTSEVRTKRQNPIKKLVNVIFVVL